LTQSLKTRHKDISLTTKTIYENMTQRYIFDNKNNLWNLDNQIYDTISENWATRYMTQSLKIWHQETSDTVSEKTTPKYNL
jgi:hypothetical protein